jgi:SAM-dependent methyltransferase
MPAPPSPAPHETPKTGAGTYSSAIAEAQNYRRWLVDSFRPYLRGRILEVGFGHGQYSSLLAPSGDYVGIDIDEASVERARLAFPGRRFEHCDIADGGRLRSLVPEGVDTVVSIAVFELVEDDASAVGHLIDVLRPGGHLLVSVPALAMLYNDIDRLAGIRRRYTTAQLRALLETQPLEIVELRYFNPIGGLGWWINSLKRHGSLESEGMNAQIRLFDRYVLPISRLVDPLFRSFFGQTVLCVARRR